MKIKDCVKVGFGVTIGVALGQLLAIGTVQFLTAVLKTMSDKPEPEKETETEE